MTKTFPRLLALSLGLLLLSGCVRTAPNLALVPADDLYAQAREAYEQRNFRRAIEYFQAFVDNHLGDPRAPEARLLLGHAYVERNEHLTGVMHYQRLVNDFPSSPLQLDARFGICEAYEELSPRPQLDQEHTQAALLHCESIVQYYPGTEQAQKAAEYVVQLRHKLARKVFENGMFYFGRKLYDAAVVYFEDVVRLYPQTSLAPVALRQLAETYSILGYVEEAEEARERLVREYPESPEAQGVRSE